MTRSRLTDRSVKSLPPAEPGKRYIIMDAEAPGLGVRVTDKGHVSFVYAGRFPGSKALSELKGRSVPSIPLPMADPRKTFTEMPPVQSLEGASNVQATLTGSAEVTGTMEGKFEVTASSTLLQVVDSVKNLSAKLQGTLNANGLGSLGHSAPDAAAPAPPISH
jgi:hypothetical protein